MRYCMMPAKIRRPAMPIDLSRAVPMISNTPVQSAPAAISPLPKVGMMTF
jgi:hypothetical protein